MQREYRIGFDLGRDGGPDARPSASSYLFNEALSLPPSVRAYHLSQFLAGIYPDRALLEVSDHRFSLQKYARDGHCTLRARSHPHSRWVTTCLWPDEGTLTWACQAWFEVEWRGLQFEVVIAQSIDDRQNVWYTFILADARADAERFLTAVVAWNAELRDEVLVYDGGSWRKDEKLFRAIKGATFDTLVLPGPMKEEIQEDVAAFFDARATYQRYGAPWQRGILFVGPPGNGKTHAVKALVNSSGQRCLYVQGFSGCRPDEASIHEVFDQARRSAPCILVLEDIDALITKRNRSVFLNELDGFAENSGILTLGTTNHADRLDPAIADRPSRFDRKYHFDPPGSRERGTYLARWNASLEPEASIAAETVAEVAADTEGFSYAYLKELFLSSLLRWVVSQQRGAMDAIMRQQVVMLREQMVTKRPGGKGNAKG